MSPDSTPDTITVHNLYRPDLNVFVSRWDYQPDAALLPPAYEHLTREALHCGCRYWLQDIRRRTLHEPAAVHWLLDTYFPQLATRLGGQLVVAYLTSPTLQEAIQSTVYPLPSAYSTEHFLINFFTDEADAVRWLMEQRADY